MSDTATVPDDQVLEFPDGIPGFAASRRFALADLGEDDTFQVLQSLDEPGVSLVVSVPWLFFPDYAPLLGDEDQRELGITSANEAIVFCAVTLDEGDEIAMNLLGPFVVNATTRQGRQVVLADGSQPIRATLPSAG